MAIAKSKSKSKPTVQRSSKRESRKRLASKTVKPNSKSTTTAPRAQRSSPASSKQDTVLTMLRQTDGTTIAAIVKVIGWQPHSVRGFFAGIVRKKLGLKLESKKTDTERVYRIATQETAS